VIAALVTPVIAAFVGLSAPRAVPLPLDIPAAQISPSAARTAQDQDLSRIEQMADAPGLHAIDRAFGVWNESEVEGTSPSDPVRALRALQVAYHALSPDLRRAFLAERSQRFLALVHQIRDAVDEGHEDRDAIRAMRRLVGGKFEERAVQSGLLEQDDIVLTAAFKLRIVLAVAPADVALISRVERIAFHGFIASRARGQSVVHRLRSVEELAHLDRAYPARLASAQLHAMAGDWDEAVTQLEHHPTPSVRTRNHLLWLAQRQQIHR
jgi:hypothetical protein